MDYIKPVMWNGKPLTGTWHLTIKVDGIRALRDTSGKVTSRNGKPLYNLDHLSFKDVEVWLGTFDKTVTACRTKNTKQVIPQSAIFELDPIDKRLDRGMLHNPTPKDIWHEFNMVRLMGHEGLVLRQGSVWLKVKKEETVDAKVIGFYGGKKGTKYEGMLGGFITDHGRVGTGISDKQRQKWWRKKWNSQYSYTATGEAPNVLYAHAKVHPLYATTIECKCMEMTKAGKMRKPRFVRLRPDK